MDENGLPTDAELEASMKPPGLSLNAPTMLAASAAALPFAVTLRIDDLHPVKAVGGLVAIVAGIVGVAVAIRRRATAPAGASGGIGVAAMAVGAFHLASAGIGLGAMGADPIASREDASAYLVENGFEDSEVVAIDGAPGEFSFEGYKDDRFCSGQVAVSAGGARSTGRWTARCGVDEPERRAERSCEDGRAASCGVAARAAREAASPDVAAAERFAARGCLADDAAACFELGLVLTASDVHDEARLARGVAAYRGACDRGSHAACNNLGLLLVEGRGTPADPSGGCDAFERACTDTYFHGCGAIADCFARGIGRPRDAERGYALYASACEHGQSNSCAPAANMRFHGEGTPADVEGGARDLRELCEAEPPNGEACVHLGLALHTGRAGVAKDQAASRALFERACQAGSGAGCRDAAIYRRDGLGGQTRDREGAATLFARGCERGDTESCDLAARLR